MNAISKSRAQETTQAHADGEIGSEGRLLELPAWQLALAEDAAASVADVALALEALQALVQGCQAETVIRAEALGALLAPMGGALDSARESLATLLAPADQGG